MGFTWRLITFVPFLLCLSLLGFVLAEARPGDFFSVIAATNTQSVTQTQHYRKQYGTEKPILQRYGQWLKRAVYRHSLGDSIAYQQSVISLICERLGATLTLTGLIALLKWALCLPLALWASGHATYKRTKLLHIIAHISLSLPDVVVAIFFMMLVLPKPALCSQFFACAVILGVVIRFGALFFLLEARWSDIRTRSFVRTAPLWGFSPKDIQRILIQQGLPELVTLFVQDLPGLFSEGMVLSMVFYLPTLGTFFQTAILTHDTNLIMAIFMILAFLVQTGQLIADAVLTFCLHSTTYRRAL